MNYSMRANGFAFMQFSLNALACVARAQRSQPSLETNDRRLVLVFVMPIGIANLGWAMYIINASWDILYVAFIVSTLTPAAPSRIPLTRQAIFWVETKGLDLEAIDALFDGSKHSDVPDVEAVIDGKAHVDVEKIEGDIRREPKAGSGAPNLSM